MIDCEKCAKEFENYLIEDCKLCIDCNYTDTCESSIRNLCENIKCKKCFENSFLSCKKSIYWDNTKNNCNPREVFKSSNKKYFFNCNDCKHDFETALSSVTNGRWCPYCSNKKLCSDKECKSCFNNSFLSHEKSIYWDNTKNNCGPREVFKSSNKKYFFNCNDCKHDFETALSSVTNGRWCPYCCFPPKKLCSDEECESCRNNSFLSHEKHIYWDNTKNNCGPREVFKSSNKKYFFNCNYCKHDFETALHHVVSGRWCPHCKYKTESIVFEFLTEKNYKFSRQQKFDWCKNEKTDKHFRFDFYIPTLKIILEIDGPQHFQQISNWQTPEISQERDIYKEKLCLENGITVIRINQEDIFYEKTDWKNDLINHLIEYTSPKIIYLCSENNYSTRI